MYPVLSSEGSEEPDGAEKQADTGDSSGSWRYDETELDEESGGVTGSRPSALSFANNEENTRCHTHSFSLELF